MKRDAKVIATEIMKLVSELAALAGAQASDDGQQVQLPASSRGKDTSGATGGIRLLIQEGKFDSPKELLEIMQFLSQEGRHYGKPTVAMGLLNLVRERQLTRFKDQEGKNWKYAVRR